MRFEVDMYHVSIYNCIHMYVTGRCVLPLVGPQIDRLKSKLGPTGLICIFIGLGYA